ncbi:uncharacterized protein LOC114162203 isoform X3 [Vigna unguiculata]|uniref:uncharacterized protein LOC114162203 isoform X3 n=1 Tax=Vigna unguiculata TaxID=3917 RepID=UPI001016EF6D|nr:uncharacterized protein LOC114162203 isoform X3 [Vigna unguiculata]
MAEKEAIEETQRKLRLNLYQFVFYESADDQFTNPYWAQGDQPVANPIYQGSPPSEEEIEAMESCPKADIENLEELLEEENIRFDIDPNYGWAPHFGTHTMIPMLVLKLKENDEQKKRPAVVFLHSMYNNKESLRPLLKAYASRGYIAISVDTCYHGERCLRDTGAYRHALVYSWSTQYTSPFIYDVVLELIKIANYLTTREDIDPSRIGITGISLGGIHAWFAAVADARYSVGFRWIIDNDKWKGLVDSSMKPLFEFVRHKMSKDVIDKEVVEKVLDGIAPSLDSQFDAPYSIPAIAPRPLLIINGAEDPQCPVASLDVTRSNASQAYEAFQCLDNFKFIAEPGVGHQLTKFQVKESSDWFDRFLKPYS